jgi:hypothetical protein
LLGSDPGSPVNGQFWYQTSAHSIRVRRNGSTVVIPADLTVTAPILNSGTQDAPVIAISAATSGAAGSMSATDKAKLDAATDAATVSTLVMRDSNARFKAADPSVASDVATKNYVDNSVAGIKWKESVRVATTANGTLATAYENGDTVDGVTLVTGDRILLKNQTTGSENGIYTVNASGAPTRATDADTAAEILQAAVWVQEGTTNADSGWVMTTNAPITLGSTSLAFSQFNGGTSYSAGAGLTLSGNTFDVGTASSGRIVVNPDNIDLASGIATPGTYRSVTVDTYGRVTGGTNPTLIQRFAANVGNGSSTSFTVNHALGVQDVIVQVYRNSSPFDVVLVDIEFTDTNNVIVRFAVAPTTNQFRVVVIG